MALLFAVAFGLLASANAGYLMQMVGNNQGMQMGNNQGMQMGNNQGMQMGNHMGNQMVPVNNQPCSQGHDGSMPEGCAIPDMTMDNMEEYLQRQMEQQQFETQAMAERIKAQFEGLMANVTMKKKRYAMSLVTEFIATCECFRSSDQIYNTVFISQARALNLTDGINDPVDYTRPPYEAKNEEEARILVFAGLTTKMCEAALGFMTFADQVNQRIPVFQGKK